METTPRSAAPEVTTRSAGPTDRAAQAALYDRCFEKRDGERVVPWRYDANPHGRALSRVGNLAGGELISNYACSPRVVLLHGEELGRPRVGQTGDVMTHPDHRRGGVFSGLDRETLADARDAGWSAVFGLPNRRSAHIFVGELGWREVGGLRPWTFVLRPDATARQARLRAGRLAAAAVPWVHRRGRAMRSRLRREAGACEARRLERFTPEVDPLSLEVARDYAWMVRRDHAYLNWRFLDAPSGRFAALGASAATGELAGYGVVQLPAAGEALGHVIEVLAPDPAAWACVLEGALALLEEAGASVARAHAVTGSRWEGELASRGFRPPKAADSKPVIAHVLAADHPLAQATQRPREWFFTDGDRDDELVR